MNNSAPPSSQQHSASPIRWAGSKRLMLPKLTDFVPKHFRTYYEPMVGSGALFFHLQAKPAILGDVNPELINFYRVLRSTPLVFLNLLHRLRPEHSVYRRVRAANPRTALKRAVRFYYLIRLSWNGLYRVNRQGRFNVPFSGRVPLQLLTRACAVTASRALRGTQLVVADFEDIILEARRGDFVYLDPPYPRGSAQGAGFARYTKEIFRDEDHMRLAARAAVLAEKGVHVLITEAARKELLCLFPRTFHLTMVRMPSLMAAKTADRRDAYEAILTSYPV